MKYGDRLGHAYEACIRVAAHETHCLVTALEANVFVVLHCHAMQDRGISM